MKGLRILQIFFINYQFRSAKNLTSLAKMVLANISKSTVHKGPIIVALARLNLLLLLKFEHFLSI